MGYFESLAQQGFQNNLPNRVLSALNESTTFWFPGAGVINWVILKALLSKAFKIIVQIVF